jgi:hypothetical protein
MMNNALTIVERLKERLKSMAQKLRTEAAALEDEEDERAQELTAIAESAFRKFDMNQDGGISLNKTRMSLINEGEPTTTDKIVSVLPYLLPLLDSLYFGRFKLAENSDNPIVGILGLLYTAFRTIPLSGLLVYLGLNFLTSNLRLNKLVRFNTQQAVVVDIALFLPSLLAAATGFVASSAGFELPPGVTELGSDAVFVAVILAIGYASISSALGITPDEIPFISQATIDMFDENGRFSPPELRDGERKDDKGD